MRALITGGTGLIGAALVRRLLGDGRHEVVAPTRAELDLLSDRSPPLDDFDAIVHLAAARDRVDAGPERWPAECELNVSATARLYDHARRSGVAHVIHLSTISVLRPSDDPDAPRDEDAPPVTPPTHPYALTKRWGEELARALRPSFASMTVVRPGSTLGPGVAPASSWGRLVEQLRRGEPYELSGARGHRLSPVFVDDVVDLLARALDRCAEPRFRPPPEGDVFNVVGPDTIDEATMLADLAAALGLPAQLRPNAHPRPLGFACTTARADAAFPERTRTPWPEMVRRTFVTAG
ncbi:MAG: SDR family oxidoreductase [Deltaproteobacteria bacterium]|nr:SDR family oxidoreductase [Deltaproteobacteria bacterium]